MLASISSKDIVYCIGGRGGDQYDNIHKTTYINGFDYIYMDIMTEEKLSSILATYYQLLISSFIQQKEEREWGKWAG